MAKLRKLLEDVHTESEQSIHMLKKKHQGWIQQSSLSDFNSDLDQILPNLQLNSGQICQNQT